MDIVSGALPQGTSLRTLPPEPFLRDLLHLLMMSRMYDFSTAKSNTLQNIFKII